MYYVVILSFLEFKSKKFYLFIRLMYPKCLVKYLAHGECQNILVELNWVYMHAYSLREIDYFQIILNVEF